MYFVTLFLLPIANKKSNYDQICLYNSVIGIKMPPFSSSAEMLSFYKASNIFHHIYFSLNIKIQ